MLNLLFVLALAITVIVQQNQKVVKNTKEPDKDVQTFVNDFKGLMKEVIDESVIDSVKITMADIQSPKVGLCWPGANPRMINLDAEAWRGYSELQKEVLIFHELAHCTCDLDHAHFRGTYPEKPAVPFEKEHRIKAGFLEDGCPVSIMYPKVLDLICYQKHRGHYRYELNLRCYSEKIYRENKR